MLLLSALIATFMSVYGNIYSIDPPDNSNGTWAFGFPSLVIHASFRPQFLDICSWQGDGGKTLHKPVYSRSSCVQPKQSNLFGNITCQVSNSVVKSNFKLTPLHKSMIVSVSCSGGALAIPVRISVQNCSSSISPNLIILAGRYDYYAKGVFGCLNNGDLFSSSGAKIQSNSTKCLAHATWEGQEDIQCWNAPTVRLMPVNISGRENAIVKVSCIETSAAHPAVHLLELVVEGEKPLVLSGPNGSIILKQSWNGKTAFCKATSNYTLQTNRPALSQRVSIAVFYGPYTNELPTVCTLYLSGGNPPCKVKFYSNPPISVYNFTKNGLSATSDKHTPVQHGANGLQTVLFFKNQVSESDAGLYTLSVNSGLNPAIRLVVNFTVVVVPAPPTTNIALIAGTSGAGTVAVIFVAVLVLVVVKRRNRARKGRNSDPISISSPVTYYNTRRSETDQGNDNQATPNPQKTHENVHHHEAISSNNRDDNRGAISQQAPSPSYESAHQYERPIRAIEQDDNRPTINQQVPSPSYESAHHYERPIRANQQDVADGAYIDFNI